MIKLVERNVRIEAETAREFGLSVVSFPEKIICKERKRTF
jgi:hypothetical protein